MKTTKILFILLILVSTQSSAQNMVAQYKDFNGKWGYVNIKGEEITDAIYTHCERFDSGLAMVDGKNFINTEGEELITTFKAQEVRKIAEGYIAVKFKGKWGVINLKGKLLIPLIYTEVTDFNEGKAAGFNSETLDIYNIEGSKTEIKIEKGRISEKGKLVIIRSFHDEMAAIAVDLDPGRGTDLQFGFISGQGEIIVEPYYHAVGDFHEGLAWVRNSEGKFGFIDKQGKLVTQLIYLKAKDYHKGHAVIRAKDGKWGFIDIKGNMVVEPKYNKIGEFKGGMLWVRGEDGKMGYINEKKEEVIALQFTRVGDFDSVSGLARVEYKENNKKKRGYVTKKGEIKHFETTNIFKHFTEGLSPEKAKDKLIGFIDNTGEWVIKPKYIVATGFKNGFSKVKMYVNHKYRWGIINKKGEWVAKPKYMKIYEFYNVD